MYWFSRGGGGGGGLAQTPLPSKGCLQPPPLFWSPPYLLLYHEVLMLNTSLITGGSVPVYGADGALFRSFSPPCANFGIPLAAHRKLA